MRWGGNDDPRDLLTMGETYAVKDVEVHSWHTKYILFDFPGKQFNSVCFKDVVPSKVAQPTPAKLIEKSEELLSAAPDAVERVPTLQTSIDYYRNIIAALRRLEEIENAPDPLGYALNSGDGVYRP